MQKISKEYAFISGFALGAVDDCWEWKRAKDKDGYGNFSAGVGKPIRAHRFSYELYKGACDGLVVRHTCDNPSCVNPKHLMIGTTQDNVDDKVSKKRHAYGSSHYRAKLSDTQVQEVIGLWCLGFSGREIGKRYGVTPSSIGVIFSGRSRPDLQSQINSLELKYPGPIDVEKRLYWKRSDNGWIRFKRRPENERKLKSKKLTSMECVICGSAFLVSRPRRCCSGKCSGKDFRRQKAQEKLAPSPPFW